MFGSILSAVGGVVGGLLGKSSKDKATAAQKDIALQELEYQKELHKNQIQWKVEDAKKAGLHPLAGLGVSSMSYSPVSGNIDTSGTDYSWMGDVGQNLNRAIMQGKTAKEREQAKDLQDQLDAINLRKANADADYAETIAASERLRLQRELFPPAPKANQSEDPQLPVADPKPAFQKFVLPDGTVTGYYPSSDYQEIHEDIPIMEFLPHARANWWHGKEKLKNWKGSKGFYKNLNRMDY